MADPGELNYTLQQFQTISYHIKSPYAMLLTSEPSGIHIDTLSRQMRRIMYNIHNIYNGPFYRFSGDSPVQYMSPSPSQDAGTSQHPGTVGGGEERYEEEEEEDISPDLWQEACWIVIRCGSFLQLSSFSSSLSIFSVFPVSIKW